MKLKDIQRLFHKTLDTIYGKQEVDSFFYLLTEHIVGLNRMALALEPNAIINKKNEEVFQDALSRLEQQEPIQYIIGETEFYGLIFNVYPDTLIPRPETEELVEWIIKNHSVQNQDAQLNILDIGTGTGCIAISLAKHLPNAKVYALDVSKNALEVARQNAENNNVSVQFINDDILNPDGFKSNIKFDIIVSNPPYVRQLEKQEIKPNVLNHEPHLALFVDDHDPLLFYRSICEFSTIYLKEKGTLYFEINQYLGKEMVDLMQTFSFKNVELKQDLFGNDRMVKAVKV
ncbi:peptide chain release factor N(5)-glutamine methyltransferase [Gaetbulibacter sp. NE]|uniref:peptide chain release factor N(5)-glutamine methyltransferase n=1 Tax=Gaetbulibacter sp. NE TaxID=2982307 RepID=UPI0021D222A8|nr:peptide chain release factor N(5)-glutamine methyltransferase [Gaetbulibacter sp. NE]